MIAILLNLLEEQECHTVPLPHADSALSAAEAGGFRAGDEQATEKVFNVMWPRLYRAAYRLLLDRDEAEEAAQHGFVRAYHARADFRGTEGGQLALWLLTAVRRNALDRLRTKKRFAPLADDLASEADGPQALAEQQETCRQVRAAMARLETGDRAVLVLFEVEQLPQAEIAADMGITVNALKVRLHRARRRFREAYLRLGGEVTEGGNDNG
jgi:RNA polymerase sigma-70 factor, ECF subfamily